MSGGAFDYNCFRIQDFADEFKEKFNKPAEYYGFSESFMKELYEYQKLIERASKIAYLVEWLYSGDIGEETFKERIKDVE